MESWRERTCDCDLGVLVNLDKPRLYHTRCTDKLNRQHIIHVSSTLDVNEHLTMYRSKRLEITRATKECLLWPPRVCVRVCLYLTMCVIWCRVLKYFRTLIWWVVCVPWDILWCAVYIRVYTILYILHSLHACVGEGKRRGELGLKEREKNSKQASVFIAPLLMRKLETMWKSNQSNYGPRMEDEWWRIYYCWCEWPLSTVRYRLDYCLVLMWLWPFLLPAVLNSD